MAQCPTCGSAIPAGAMVCPDCGMELALAAPEIDEAAPEPETTALPAIEAAPDAMAPASEAAPPEVEAVEAAGTIAVAGAATLTLRRGGTLTNERFEVGERVTLGRFDPESGPVDVDFGPLPEASYISRHHAELWRDAGGQWLLRDLGSRNGTFVRAVGASGFVRVTDEHPVGDGDEIALGNARFEFHVG